LSEGRRREFPHFRGEDVPDPQDRRSFARSRLHWELADRNASVLRWFRELIALRKQHVTAKERTCRAQLQDGNILLQAPQNEPRVVVIAGLPGRTADLPSPPHFRLALRDQEDGYFTRIYVKKAQ
jgi:pullulanase/glycogen debranching enzyme